jgi:micrococcal nuclease
VGHYSPEKKQDFGTRAKQFTGDLAFQKTVTVRVKDHDRYGRTVAEIMLPNGGNLNKEILKAGMAWVFRRYCHDKTYYRLESEAKEQRIGLWSQPHPTAPWDFRKTVVMQ